MHTLFVRGNLSFCPWKDSTQIKSKLSYGFKMSSITCFPTDMPISRFFWLFIIFWWYVFLLLLSIYFYFTMVGISQISYYFLRSNIKTIKICIKHGCYLRFLSVVNGTCVVKQCNFFYYVHVLLLSWNNDYVIFVYTVYIFFTWNWHCKCYEVNKNTIYKKRFWYLLCSS